MENHINNTNNNIQYEHLVPCTKPRTCNVIPSPFLLESTTSPSKYPEHDDFILNPINTFNIPTTYTSESEDDYLSNESSADESPIQRVIPHYKCITTKPKHVKHHSIWKKHIHKEQSTLNPNQSLSILQILESYINDTSHKQPSSI